MRKLPTFLPRFDGKKKKDSKDGSKSEAKSEVTEDKGQESLSSKAAQSQGVNFSTPWVSKTKLGGLVCFF